ncbi:MAG: RdgB/HAM1 family non-canonical purine NTP pyrophosphatase [Proteobacteria bacterium]|nr:RdgB/HAM1 family non-canonical purine NTP pyrophosphatase [Pseudomonadota bacterium]
MNDSNEKEIVIATGNKHKLREFGQLFEPFGLTVKPAERDWIAGVRETGASFVENALIKARAVSAHTNSIVVADDSGLVVEALGGAPGIYSSRYAGENSDDDANNRKLLDELADVADRRAYFYCAIVALRQVDDPCPSLFIGRWDGEIAISNNGQSGFGYDPLFYLAEHQQTAAQMSAEKKNSLSHRGRAVRQLLMQLCQAQSIELSRAAATHLATIGDPGPQ